MDKHTVITDLKLATEVIGAETASLIEKYAEKKAAGDRSKVKASDALFVAGFKPEWCVSPFRAKNNIDPDTIAGEYLGAERTFGQLYDGLKVVLAHGYFSATAFELFMKDPKKLSRAESAAQTGAPGRPGENLPNSFHWGARPKAAQGTAARPLPSPLLP